MQPALVLSRRPATVVDEQVVDVGAGEGVDAVRGAGGVRGADGSQLHQPVDHQPGAGRALRPGLGEQLGQLGGRCSTDHERLLEVGRPFEDHPVVAGLQPHHLVGVLGRHGLEEPRSLRYRHGFVVSGQSHVTSKLEQLGLAPGYGGEDRRSAHACSPRDVSHGGREIAALDEQLVSGGHQGRAGARRGRLPPRVATTAGVLTGGLVLHPGQPR